MSVWTDPDYGKTHHVPTKVTGYAALGTLPADTIHQAHIGAFGDPRRNQAESIARELAHHAEAFAKAYGLADKRRLQRRIPFEKAQHEKLSQAMFECSERIHDALQQEPPSDRPVRTSVPPFCWDILWAFNQHAARTDERRFPNPEQVTIPALTAFIAEERTIEKEEKAARKAANEA